MLNPEFKAKWVAALRSGQYKQGDRRLRRSNNTFCCLGVACDLLGVTWRDPKEGDDCYTYKGADGDLNSSALSAEILDAIDLTDKQQWELVYLNDGINPATRVYDRTPANFNEIATFIEEQL